MAVKRASGGGPVRALPAKGKGRTGGNVRSSKVSARQTKAAANSLAGAKLVKKSASPSKAAAKSKASFGSKAAPASVAGAAPKAAVKTKPAAATKPAAQTAAKVVRGGRSTSSKTASARLSTVQPKALVAKIYATIEGELSKLERQVGNKSQDRERASRALSQVVSSFKNAVQMHNEMVKTKPKARSAEDKEALAHAEDLRKEIAERLERLRVQRRGGK